MVTALITMDRFSHKGIRISTPANAQTIDQKSRSLLIQMATLDTGRGLYSSFAACEKDRWNIRSSLRQCSRMICDSVGNCMLRPPSSVPSPMRGQPFRLLRRQVSQLSTLRYPQIMDRIGSVEVVKNAMLI